MSMSRCERALIATHGRTHAFLSYGHRHAMYMDMNTQDSVLNRVPPLFRPGMEPHARRARSAVRYTVETGCVLSRGFGCCAGAGGSLSAL